MTPEFHSYLHYVYAYVVYDSILCCPNAPHTGVHWDTFSNSLNCKYLCKYLKISKYLQDPQALESLKCRYDIEVQAGKLDIPNC